MICQWLILVAIANLAHRSTAEDTETRLFPDDFMFGCATASYQIEGAWNEDGKTENIWDRLVHTQPQFIADKYTGDVACDSYRLYEKDVELLVNLGVQHYRFSISWARILPTASNTFNELGVAYYNKLIDLLVKNNIKPLVTIYHWDLPQYLQDIGGWANPQIVDYFEMYSRVLFDKFGDRVKYWLTINEPHSICHQGYGSDEKAPVLNSAGIAEYLCGHYLLLSHARAYHVYDTEFRKTQEGRVGITINTNNYEPVDPDNPDDVEAADWAFQFNYGWFGHPIYSKEGNYPDIMMERIAYRSVEEGYLRSRLPTFTDEEITYVQGTYDFMGVNEYSTRNAKKVPEPEIGTPSWEKDEGVEEIIDPTWPESASTWLQVVPFGMQKLMQKMKKEYGDIPIIITENGFTDKGGLDDTDRIEYFRGYLSYLLKAILDDNVDVIGYTAWSCLDNFEWISGYNEKFGLYSVDFESKDRTRTAKKSADFYKNVIKNRCLLDDPSTCSNSPGDSPNE